MNSLIAVALNLVGMLLIYSLMAMALTRFYWRGQGMIGVLGTIFVAGLFWIVPTLVPNLRNLESARYSLWFGNALVSCFSVIILCQSVRRIPRELEDSARLDGCGWLGTYRQIVLPLVRRELGLIALLILMATSPIFWAALTTPSGFPSPWWLLPPMGSEGGPDLSGVLLTAMAGSIIMTLPAMLVFLLSKSWFPRLAKRESE